MEQDYVFQRLMQSGAFHVDKQTGTLEVDLLRLLDAVGWEPTEENKDKLTEMLRDVAAQRMPNAEQWESRRATVTGKGVWIFGRHYYDDAMSLLKGRTVEVRYRAHDQSEVWIYKNAAKFKARPVEQ